MFRSFLTKYKKVKLTPPGDKKKWSADLTYIAYWLNLDLASERRPLESYWFQRFWPQIAVQQCSGSSKRWEYRDPHRSSQSCIVTVNKLIGGHTRYTVYIMCTWSLDYSTIARIMSLSGFWVWKHALCEATWFFLLKMFWKEKHRPGGEEGRS